ncbi:MAG: hypothetical protein IMW93_05070 [Thermoanaerobacteraceae bacterium]|nr:hypothetical protein [Thermoanaerobacteraceae bacterium]
MGKNNKLPEGFHVALNYPLFEAIGARRSRRFGLGMALESQALGFTSPREPVPLSEEEESLLIWAATGLTGSQLGDLPPKLGLGLMVQSTGRTWPSSCNNQGTELFYTNDRGTYMVKIRDLQPDRMVGLLFSEDMTEQEKAEKILATVQSCRVQMSDQRADLPKGMPGLFDFNAWNTNKPGTTLFIPVTNVTIEYINLLFLYTSSKYGFVIIDELNGGRPAGMEEAVKKGYMQGNLTLSLMDLEMRVLSMLVVEQAFICQNINLALQAMGLGGWTFTGFVARFLLGGVPPYKGLGFRFITPKKGLTDPPQSVPVGIDGLYQAYCPPYYKDMDAAVDAFLADKNLCSQRTVCYRQPDNVREELKDLKPERIEVVKAVCNYIYETYGRFPAFIDPMYSRLTAQAHHLELEFYDKYYPPGSYTDLHRRHFQLWHPELPDPFRNSI